MKKSERLFYILDILNSGKRVSHLDMARTFDVSVRTMFRDLKELKRLGFGTKRPSANPRHTDKFSGMEVRLIRFALETHPLVHLFPFRELSKKLSSSGFNIEELVKLSGTFVESKSARVDIAKFLKEAKRDGEDR